MSIFSGFALLLITEIVCLKLLLCTKNLFDFDFETLLASIIASAAAVGSSSNEALEISMEVKSEIMV